KTSIPLTTPDPNSTYSVIAKNIDLDQIISIMLPDYSHLIKGQANLSCSGTSYLPNSVNFAKGLSLSGQFDYPNGKIETLNIIALVKDRLQKIPGISSSEMKIIQEPMEGKISSGFVMKNQIITLTQFKLESLKQEEINLSGQLMPNKDINMKGSLKLVHLPLKGDFIVANQDNSGRVVFPIDIKGSLLHPQWSFLGNSIDTMKNKFFEYEKNKSINLAKKEVVKKSQQLKQSAQKEIDAQKRNITNSAKKALEGLFK
ncbi:MAG: hypothetical protein KDD45_09005, partial [Bdellovibrionales bacterium]|nr:hypothetical protein [Bdellovibrionales bacterium]